MIQVENVSKRFLTTKALKNCTTTLDEGKIIGIIGENGSGKTTLLKLLAGLLRPTNGRVMIDSEQVNRRISRKVAYLTDSEYFFPYFTVEEVIDYYQTQFPDFNKEKAYEMAAFMNLDREQKIKYLSKGNKTRIKIVVTLSRKSPYIVLDEPFSGLDPMVRKAIINSIIKFIDIPNQTLILSTHELREVEAILDEVVVLKHGKIIAQKPVELIREENQMNVVDWMEEVYTSTGMPVS